MLTSWQRRKNVCLLASTAYCGLSLDDDFLYYITYNFASITDFDWSSRDEQFLWNANLGQPNDQLKSFQVFGHTRSILSPLTLLKNHSYFSIVSAVAFAPPKTSNLASFSVTTESSVVARCRAMQLLAPLPNGKKSRFIWGVASNHRSGRNSSGCGNTSSARCS